MTTPTAPMLDRRARLRSFIDRLERWVWGGPYSELIQIPERELEFMAHDIGVSMHDLRRLTRTRSDGQLLYLRLAQLELDGATLKEQGYLRDIERTCALCDSQHMCQHDLNERPESNEWEHYCPNFRTLRFLLVDADKRCTQKIL